MNLTVVLFIITSLTFYDNILFILAVRSKCSLPIVIGSGITEENYGDFMDADAFIIGSYFKTGGKWFNELDSNKIKRFMNLIKS